MGCITSKTVQKTKVKPELIYNNKDNEKLSEDPINVDSGKNTIVPDIIFERYIVPQNFKVIHKNNTIYIKPF